MILTAGINKYITIGDRTPVRREHTRERGQNVAGDPALVLYGRHDRDIPAGITGRFSFSLLTSGRAYVRMMGVWLSMLLHGEMAEWSKAPVLKTGDVKASVGSNPTLSASFITGLRKYPSGRRGSPAKGVDA